MSLSPLASFFNSVRKNGCNGHPKSCLILLHQFAPLKKSGSLQVSHFPYCSSPSPSLCPNSLTGNLGDSWWGRVCGYEHMLSARHIPGTWELCVLCPASCDPTVLWPPQALCTSCVPAGITFPFSDSVLWVKYNNAGGSTKLFVALGKM